jgi:hypothetical protein
MIHATALIAVVLAAIAPAQVAVIPFQRTADLSPDDALLLQEVISGLVDESLRFTLVPVTLEDLMAGRVPQFVIAGALRHAADGALELELNLQVKGKGQAMSSTLRQGVDLPALAGALDGVLASLFGAQKAAPLQLEPIAPEEVAAAPAVKTAKPSRFFARAWQPYAAILGTALGATGGVLWVASDEGLIAMKAEYEAEANSDRKEQRRAAYNAARDRQLAGRSLALGAAITGFVGVALGLIP